MAAMVAACDTAAAAEAGATTGGTTEVTAGTAEDIADTATAIPIHAEFIMAEGVAGGGVTASAYGCAAVAAVVTRSVDTVIVMATVTGAAGTTGTAIFEDMAGTSDDTGVTSVGAAGGANPLRS